MMLGRVTGQLVATRKHAALESYRLLVIRPYGLYEPAHAVDLIVAVDVVERYSRQSRRKVPAMARRTKSGVAG